MPFCVSCGTKLSDDARFCYACGTKVEFPTEPVVIPPAQAPVIQEIQKDPPVYIPPVEEPFYETLPEEPSYQEPVYEVPVSQAPAYQQPEMAVPPAEAVPETPRKEKLFKKKPIPLGRRLLAIFLCILTFLFGTATLAAYCIQDVISAEVITALVDEIDMSEIEARDLITTAKKGDSLTQWVYEEMKARVPKLGMMTEENVQTYLETFIYPFVKEEAVEFIEVLLTGKGEAAITREEVRLVLESSTDYLEEKHSIYLSDQDITKMVNWLVASELEEKANTDYLEDEFSDALEVVRFLDGSIVTIVFAGLTLTMLVLLILTNKCLIRNLNSVGLVSLSLGGIFGLVALADLMMPKLMLQVCSDSELVANLVGSIVKQMHLPLAILAGTGIVLLAVSNGLQAIKVKAK